ncbi:hypothetical protein dqs_0587 [Azoarcus olearius]|uniref:hypothetical protein n=1 Tax=Azoarcus sp. (strain BH72) TaxID=418699 RepID=UPI000806115A|nr:hypothetical protein [Azoarcus olearius]ANQ83663.1 hypothetical protein dqs_0587 [Azoarcus olearius]
MLIQQTVVRRLEITEAPGLDPIRVYLENYAPGKGRITISCYDRAWVGYWGAMSGKTVEQFFASCDAEYLRGNLMCGVGLSRGKQHEAYVLRVIQAVQGALRENFHAA